MAASKPKPTQLRQSYARPFAERDGRTFTPPAATGLMRSVPSTAAGVYLPSHELAHLGHDLTQKIRRSKVSRENDPLLARLLATSANERFADFTPDLVISIPPKPGQEDRFRSIRRDVASRTGAADAGAALTQSRVVMDYRRMPLAQRRAASVRRFVASDFVRGKAVLLIDDVLTSGGQAADAMRALNEAGAAELRFACIARTTGDLGGQEPRRKTNGCP